jgi:hypothetical protein
MRGAKWGEVTSSTSCPRRASAWPIAMNGCTSPALPTQEIRMCMAHCVQADNRAERVA